MRFEALDDDLMLRALPGVFCAGEMLDWEAPTGGYLLTACFATGRVAGERRARGCHREGRQRRRGSRGGFVTAFRAMTTNTCADACGGLRSR